MKRERGRPKKSEIETKMCAFRLSIPLLTMLDNFLKENKNIKKIDIIRVSIKKGIRISEELLNIEQEKLNPKKHVSYRLDNKSIKILSDFVKDTKIKKRTIIESGLTEIFDEIHNGKSIHEIIREG